MCIFVLILRWNWNINMLGHEVALGATKIFKSNAYLPTNDQRNNLGPLLAPPIGGLVSALVDHMLKLLSILWSSAAPFASRSQWSDSRIHCVIGILVPLLRGIVYHSVPPSKNSLVNGVYYRGVEKDFHIMHAVQCTWYVTYWTNWSCKVGMFNPVILSIYVTLALCTMYIDFQAWHFKQTPNINALRWILNPLLFVAVVQYTSTKSC